MMMTSGQREKLIAYQQQALSRRQSDVQRQVVGQTPDAHCGVALMKLRVAGVHSLDVDQRSCKPLHFSPKLLHISLKPHLLVQNISQK